MGKFKAKLFAVSSVICVFISVILVGCNNNTAKDNGSSSSQSSEQSESKVDTISSDKLVEGVTIQTDPTIKNNPFSLGVDSYNDENARIQLKIIATLGFNAVRIMPPFDVDGAEEYASNLDGNLETYKKLLKACKENGIRVLPVLLPKVIDNNYLKDDNVYYRLLRAFKSTIEPEYRDIIIGIEICDKPDVNVSGLTRLKAKELVEADSYWNDTGKPFIDWAIKSLNGFNSTSMVSAGFQSSPRFNLLGELEVDFVGFYASESTLGRIYSVMKEIVDGKTVSEMSKIILLGVGEQENYLQPAGEVIAFCRENNVGYFLHDYLDIYNELFQSLFDSRGRLHLSGLTYDIILAYSTHSTVRVAGNDITYGGNGAIEQALVDITEALKESEINSTDNTALSHAAQRSYNTARSLVPYYLPEFREFYYFMDGDDDAKFKNVIYYSMIMMKPYVRSYGSYLNDNSLGGKAIVNYSDYSAHGFNNPKRARYALELGKGESNGIWTESENLFLTDYLFKKTESYNFSVDINPSKDNFAAIAFAGNKVIEGVEHSAAYSGFYIKLYKNKSSYNAAVSVVGADGVERHIASFDVPLTAADESGFLKLGCDISYGGGKYSLDVLINGESVGKAEAALDLDEMFFGLYSPSGAPAYYDNMVLSNKATNAVIFSDAFEQCRVDNDYVVYDASKNSAVTNEIDKIIKLVKAVDKFELVVPKRAQAFSNNRVLTIVWDDTSSGESGYEVQRSSDGSKWETYWRCPPNSTSAVIPLYADYAIGFTYRVSPVAADNSTEHFSDRLSVQKTEDPAQDIIQKFTVTSGQTYIVKIQGTTVVVALETDVEGDDNAEN